MQVSLENESNVVGTEEEPTNIYEGEDEVVQDETEGEAEDEQQTEDAEVEDDVSSEDADDSTIEETEETEDSEGDDQETVDEDDDIEIEYDGQSYKADDLEEVFKERAELKEKEQSFDGLLKDVEPLVERYSSSKLLSAIDYYKQQGYSDNQVAKALQNPQVLKQIGLEAEEQQEEVNLEDMSEEERIEYLVNKRVEEKVGPFEEKFSSQATQQQQQQLAQRNLGTLTNAFSSKGYNVQEFDNATWQTVEQTLNNILPGFDIKQQELQPGQAEALVQLAMDQKPAAKKPDEKAERKIKIKNARKQQTVPKVSPGGKKGKPRGKPSEKGLSSLQAKIKQWKSWTEGES